MKRVLYLTVFLAVVAGLAGGLLSFVNDATLEKREQAAIAEEVVNLDKIFPGAEFKAVDEADINDETGQILGIFESDAGVVYKMQATGYGGDIIFVVGIDKDDKLAGVEVISHSESPGFGDVIATDKYRDNIKGKASNDELSTLSGATISTTATNGAIKIATDHYNANKGIDSDGGAKAEKPKLELGDKINLSDEKLDRYKAEIKDTKESDAGTVYTVEAEGYKVKDDEYGQGGKSNIFEVTVKDNKIADIKAIEVHDTEGVGTRVDDVEYFETLIGIDLTLDQDVDVVSEATKTSYSLLSALKAVINEGN